VAAVPPPHRHRRALCCTLAAGGEGAALPEHHSAYHRVFSAARWSLDAVGLAVLALALASGLAASGGGGGVLLVVDDTLCRRRGRRLWGVGVHYDPSLTSRAWSDANKSVKSRGHCWVVLGVAVELPCRPGHYYCLPVLFRLCLNRKSAARHRLAYRSRPDLARDVLRLACGRSPARRFHLLADSAYAGQDTLKGLPANCDLTARWPVNAVLHEPPPPRAGPASAAATGCAGRGCPRRRGCRRARAAGAIGRSWGRSGCTAPTASRLVPGVPAHRPRPAADGGGRRAPRGRAAGPGQPGPAGGVLQHGRRRGRHRRGSAGLVRGAFG
jgi:hypothetical protein